MGLEFSDSVLAGVSLAGKTEGAVKQLSGFRRDRHTVPDAVNAVTQGFLARLCEPELKEEAEDLFQRARAALGYKRKDLTVDYAPAQASLVGREFTLDITYELGPHDPARYTVNRTLQRVSSGDVVTRPEFNGVFGRMFTQVVFALARGVSVEAVIDAVEGQSDASGSEGLRVNYPSDCSECVLTVAGVDAQVRCSGLVLSMEFPRPGTPGDLLEAFAAVRRAFFLSKDPVLGALI